MFLACLRALDYRRFTVVMDPERGTCLPFPISLKQQQNLYISTVIQYSIYNHGNISAVKCN